MPDRLQGVENKAPAVSERRASQRLRVSSLVYVELGKENGGIVTVISENGLALMAAANLGERGQDDELFKMRIQLPGLPGGIEADGQIVWRGNSGKEAGVRFVDLGVEAREQIRNWIATQGAKNAALPDQAELPELKPAPSKPAKARGPKFSFSDVASSRVDGEEGEAMAGDLPEVDETEWLPSQSVENGAFVEATKAVAAAFESPAFEEDRETEADSVQDQEEIQARQEEKGWGEPSADLRRKEGESRTRQDVTREAPSFGKQESSVSEPAESGTSFEKRVRTAVSSRTALFASGIKGAFARTPIRKHVARIKPPRRPEPSAKLRGRVARRALASAAVVTLFGAGWIFLQRGSLNEAIGVIAQNRPSPPIPSDSRNKAEVTAGSAARAKRLG